MEAVDKSRKEDIQSLPEKTQKIVRELASIKDRTDKDLLVAVCMHDFNPIKLLDSGARIAPALFLQPHFGNLKYELNLDAAGRAVMHSEEYEKIKASPVFRAFKYIKTFTPMRRITNSYGASIRFICGRALNYHEGDSEKVPVMDDNMLVRVLNRSYLRAPEDRLYRDSVLVRFEDGKLNPKATFTALAAFLDLPYTESMTYCSLFGKHDPESLKGNDLGFSTAALYRTYDDYANDDERAFIEYFMRDAYEAYGYDFMYYDGGPVDEARVDRWIDGFTTIEHYIRTTWETNVLSQAKVTKDGKAVSEEEAARTKKESMERHMKALRENWHNVAHTLLRGLRFVSKEGQPLQMMPKLELDPALLEQPLYH